MLSEIRIAARRLVRAPIFTATALATLAVCIGANLTVFAVIDAVLIRPLPFPRADRLVTMYFVYPRLPSASPGASLTNYYERRGKLAALASLSALDENTSVIGETGSTSIEKVGRVTPEFFRTLGVTPFMGRAFTEAEMTYQTDHEAMLSYEYWRANYASDPNILGKSIRTDGQEHVIVGILPPDFRFLSFRPPVYQPLSSEEGERNVGARHSIGKILVGRLAATASLADVQAQVNSLDAVLAPEFPEAKIVADAGTHTVVAPLQGDYVASVRPMLLMLQAGALVLLLIGCVNLVNLLLIRASSRSREMAIRQALGAGRRQVVRDVLTETMLLTLFGAALGLWVGLLGIQNLARLGVDQLPLGAEVTFNGKLAAGALLCALLIGALTAVPLSWFNLGGGLSGALKSGSRGGTAGRSALRLRRGFIVVQVALAFVLLTGAGLLGLSLRRAMAVAPGFRADHVITGEFNLTWKNYPQLDTFHKFFDRLFEQTATLPGVSSVGAVTQIPVVGPTAGNALSVPGYVPARGESEVLVHDVLGVAGAYFEAMGIPLVSGRFLEAEDAVRDPLTCVVDEAFARHYWPAGAAVGKQIYPGTGTGDFMKLYTVVGVVGTVKQTGLTQAISRGAVYFPYSRQFFRNYFLVARTSLPPEAVAGGLVKAVRAADGDVPLTHLRAMETNITESLSTRRSPALMATVFAGSALLLASIGLYGVMAYAVAQRTREFGVRIALGARNLDVLGLVFAEGVRLAGAGLVLGLVLSLSLTRFLDSQLFGIHPNDPGALAAVGLLITIVVIVACLIPARRATRVDPIIVLKAE